MRAVTVALSLLMISEAAALAQSAAGEIEPTVEAAKPKADMFVSVNAPLWWLAGKSYAGSVGWGWGHNAIRINLAHYNSDSDVDAAAVALFGAEDEAIRSGDTTDVGIGWMLFPRRLWGGPTFEIGALGRFRDTSIYDDFAEPQRVETHTMTLGGRGLVGWSWLFGDHFFVSAAVGLSVGHESGTERIESDPDIMETSDVSRVNVAPEGFLRIGLAWGLKSRKKTN